MKKKLLSILLAVTIVFSAFIVPVSSVGAAENQIIVHYYNENAWDNPYIYYYTDSDQPVTWPGEAMEAEDDDWYVFTIDGYSSVKVIFSNNGDDQYPAQNEDGLSVSGEVWYKSGSFYSQNPDDLSITVYYYNYDLWSEPYIYYYTDSDQPVTWPGEAMSAYANGWYYYDIYGLEEVKVIFSDNGSNQIPSQGEEGYTISSDQWYVNGTWYDSEPEAITVHFYDYDDWGQVNLYYYSGDLEGSEWTGLPMTADGDGWYTYYIYGLDEAKVLFNDGNGTQIPGVMEEGFSVSGEMWYRNGEWTEERPDEILVYFYKPDDWGEPNIYYYLTDSDTGKAWPGEAMTEVYDGWYLFTITKYSEAKVLFNDGTNQIPAQNEAGLDAVGVMWYKDGTWCDSQTDTDGDELLDCLELVLGTDIDKTDTDGDGLPDGYEVLTLGTDPLLNDSDENGTDDGDEDADGDGLTNLTEYELGTDPTAEDSDGDGLNDYDEVYVYFTDPLNEDTDGDTLSDSDDLALGFSPLLQDTDSNGVLDCDEKIEQILSNDRIDEELFTDNVAILTTLNIYGAGNINSSMTVSEYDGYLKDDGREYVGKVIEITGNNFESGEITFTLSDEYEIEEYDTPDGVTTNGLLICYSDGDTTTPLETYYDEETKTLTAEIYDTGIYFVLDFMLWVEILGVEAEENSASTVQLSSVSDTSTTTDIAGVSINGQVDIVFVIDTTGSMTSSINNVKNNIISFVENLSDANISASFALVDFRDITCDGEDYTNVKKNGNSNWFTSVEDFVSVVSSLTVSGGGDNPETPIDGLEMARNLDFRSSAQKFIVLVTDADYKTDNNYGISSMDEMAQLFVDDDINVSVISSTDYQSSYSTLYESTDGVFGNIYADFASVMLTISEKISQKTNDGYWIGLKGFLVKIARLDEEPTSESTADTDGDDLLDVEELKSTWPEYAVDLNDFYQMLLKSQLDIVGYTYPTIKVYDYYSDPTLEDTDGDELIDINDPAPTNEYNVGKALEIFSEERLDALDEKYEEIGNSNSLIFSDENLQETREGIIVLQKCLEYLGYLDMEESPYGKLGGKTYAAIYLYRVNHRFYKNGDDVRYGIDDITFYSIIKSAYDSGFTLDDESIEEEMADFFAQRYLPTSIILKDLPYSECVESQLSSEIETIYTYDLTTPLESVLEYAAKDAHYNCYNCYVIFDYQVCIPKNMLTTSLWLIENFSSDNKYDIKEEEKWNDLFKDLDLASIPFFHVAFPFVFQGEEINAEIFGNILFGYIGNACGFNDMLLVVGGSLYSLYKEGSLDNEEDSTYISQGYYLYEEYGYDYTYFH